MGSPQRGLEARWRLAEWEVPHPHADKTGGTIGDRDIPRNPGFQRREIKPHNLTEKNLWGLRHPEKLPASQEFVGETHRDLESRQTHLPGNQHQRAQFACR